MGCFGPNIYSEQDGDNEWIDHLCYKSTCLEGKCYACNYSILRIDVVKGVDIILKDFKEYHFICYVLVEKSNKVYNIIDYLSPKNNDLDVIYEETNHKIRFLSPNTIKLIYKCDRLCQYEGIYTRYGLSEMCEITNETKEIEQFLEERIHKDSVEDLDIMGIFTPEEITSMEFSD